MAYGNSQARDQSLRHLQWQLHKGTPRNVLPYGSGSQMSEMGIPELKSAFPKPVFLSGAPLRGGRIHCFALSAPQYHPHSLACGPFHLQRRQCCISVCFSSIVTSPVTRSSVSLFYFFF